MPDVNRPEDRDGWNVTTLRESMLESFAAMRSYQEAQMNDLKGALLERYETQTKALDAAFNAASQAVATALLSAREASTKAEVNAERRFDLFRIESGMQIKTVADKQAEEANRVAKSIGDLTTRLDLSQGQGTGADKQKTTLLAVGGFIIAATALITRLLFP